MPIAFRSILSSQGGSGGDIQIDSLEIISPATKTTYAKGDSPDLTGLVVMAYAEDLSGDVTQNCVVSPSVFSMLGLQTVTLTYHSHSVSYDVMVTDQLRLVPWSTGTDLEIIAMLNAYYNDELDIYSCEGWEIGAEREVQLSAMPATGVNESHVAQTVKFMLMDKGVRDLVTPINGHTKCAFVVGQGDVLMNNKTNEPGYVHNSYYDVVSWENYKRRAWCNDVYRNALPENFRSIFKQFYNPIADPTNTVKYIEDYFTLPSVSEVMPDKMNQTYEGCAVVQEGSTLVGYAGLTTAYPRGKSFSYWFRSIPMNKSFYIRAICGYCDGGGDYLRFNNADRTDLSGFAPQGVI